MTEKLWVEVTIKGNTIRLPLPDKEEDRVEPVTAPDGIPHGWDLPRDPF